MTYTNQSAKSSMQLVETSDLQSAQFDVLLHITGGMGDAKVETDVVSLPMYLSGDAIQKIITFLGSEERYYAGSRLTIDAEIQLVKETDVNESIPGSPKMTYYNVEILSINHIVTNAQSE